ncbi:hypothetical protein Sinac_3521 [Singulisphaera acidiphila DSM 18658]|uniref:Uncharacterized protein n=1 Tax=Singulisphaera acidiphila (strain ATCC BAA-1392 / DSM 18658 / VKM B-2454 / MOB10) TaxID=886293 RepID=L0DET3_SINAD|nr:hypothetical protein Sinac_3521 [Singulisphaera acidiphila DSM 18658]
MCARKDITQAPGAPVVHARAYICGSIESDRPIEKSDEGKRSRRLFEAGGPPGREDAPGGGRGERIDRDGHGLPEVHERGGFAETGRVAGRDVGKSRLTARGGIEAGCRIRQGLRCRWGGNRRSRRSCLRFSRLAAARVASATIAAFAIVRVRFRRSTHCGLERGRRCLLAPLAETDHEQGRGQQPPRPLAGPGVSGAGSHANGLPSQKKQGGATTESRPYH